MKKSQAFSILVVFIIFFFSASRDSQAYTSENSWWTGTLVVVDESGRNGCFQLGDRVSATLTNVTWRVNRNYWGHDYSIGDVVTAPAAVTYKLVGQPEAVAPITQRGKFCGINNGTASCSLTFDLLRQEDIGRTFDVIANVNGHPTMIIAKVSYRGQGAGIQQNCTSEEKDQPDGVMDYQLIPFKLCDQIIESEAKNKCDVCLNDSKGIWTAVGCIPANAESITAAVIKIGIGLSGGITLIMILVASFKLSVSQGDPKAVNDAKERITSAIIGLIFIILSISILQFIGIKLLTIPGFG